MVSFKSLFAAALSAAAVSSVHATLSVGAGGSATVSVTPPLDICANVNLDFKAFFNGLLGIRLPSVGTQDSANICLCVGLIPGLIELDANVKAAAELAGQNAVSAALHLLINDSPDKKTCQYPAHSSPLCAPENACSWQCTDGFVKNGNQCVCPSGKHLSGNQCVSTAPSARAVHHRRIGQGQGGCAANRSVCGGFRGPTSFECVDTTTDLYSCGGCTTPLAGLTASGQDCSAIPNVNVVGCSRSKCVVSSCRSGFKVADDKASCVAA